MKNRSSETNTQKNPKKVWLIIVAAIVVLAALAVLTVFVIIPAVQYGAAEKAAAAGDYAKAYEAFIALADYRDSQDQAAAVYNNYLKQKLQSAQAGDVFTFGTYEQDNDSANGPEKLEWYVLAKEEGKVLVLSKYALNCLPYNQLFASAVWESCSLRAWLNEDFLNAAFTAEEQAMIPVSTVTADANPQFRTDPGNDTLDQVFLLSALQGQDYEKYPEIMRCEPTLFAMEQGVEVNDNNHCSWWLRSPGLIPADATAVSTFGDVYEFGNYVFFDFFGVRPAMWLSLAE